MPFVRSFSLDTPARRGAILLVVITMLTLFSAVGLSFVFYAQFELLASQTNKEGAATPNPDVDPELAMAFFLGKLIYGDSDDNGLGLNSAIRGHELMRAVTGFSHDYAAGNIILGSNESPFNGTGRIHNVYAAGDPAILQGFDDYDLINYTFHQADGFLRDPERLGYRANPAAARGEFTGGYNVPYTYADLHSLALAVVRTDGTVASPSFHRHYLFNVHTDATTGTSTYYDLNDPNNPNWNNDIGKYLLLRPRPKEHPGFPMPESPGGDVKNWPFGPGGNDSIWIDCGAPVMTASDGRKYKMLFAPLIVELDSRLNVNVMGNLGRDPKGNPGVHQYNQGLGRWEIDPGRVLDAAVAGKPEWPNLLVGRATPPQQGRYGSDGLPNPGAVPIDLRKSPASIPPGAMYFSGGNWYAPVDADGTGKPLTMPAAGTFFGFPNYPAGYDNLGNNELENHPARYNFLDPAAGADWRFRASDMEALLRYTDKGSPALTSDLFKALMLNLREPGKGERRRSLLTTHSFDRDRPGAMAYITGPSRQAGQQPYLYVPAARQPAGAAIPFPPPSARSGAVGAEFGVDWRSGAARLQRIDLNRPLLPYPKPDKVTGRIDLTVAATLAAYRDAERQRTSMARELYGALVAVTGALDPNLPGGAKTGTPEYEACRWLAQLAVNIVDYIDADDYITPWRWDESTGTTVSLNQFVYGTELPRLVLNEIYAQMDNDTADPGLPVGAAQTTWKATKYRLNLWVELLNPLKDSTDPFPLDGGTAILHLNGEPVYDIVLARPAPAGNPPDGKLRNPTNTRGDIAATDTDFLKRLTKWGNVDRVLPAGTNYNDPALKNTGFCVIAPDPNPADATKRFVQGGNPFITPNPTIFSPDLSVEGILPADFGIKPLVLLRRLANPHLRFNVAGQAGFDPNMPLNPFITVDYAHVERVERSALYRDTVAGPQTNTFVSPPNRKSRGRTQPYAAATFIDQQLAVGGVPGNGAVTTFYRHNARENAPPISAATAGQTLKTPFDWLVHLDRPLVSPMELLHVHGGRPHDLTRDFVTGATAAAPYGTTFGHRAPWFDPAARIHRFLEFVRTREPSADAVPGGRVAGKVNINMVFEEDVFLSLCGVRPGSPEEAVAKQIWQRFVQLRTPPVPPQGAVPERMLIGPTTFHTATPKAGFAVNRPITGLSLGGTPSGQQYPDPLGAGIQNTLLQPNPPNGPKNALRLFADGTPGKHPYEQFAMLTRLYNNVTTRSNVFAVFVTVGFFEVKDDTTRPVRLGAEIGRSENRQVRHRFFAIVDRSAVRMQLMDLKGNPTRLTFQGTKIDPNDANEAPKAIILRPGQTQEAWMTRNDGGINLVWDVQTGAKWVIQPGTALTLEPGTPNEETVYVTETLDDTNKVFPPRFKVRMRRSHPIGMEIRPLGHPGPWARYDPRRDGPREQILSILPIPDPGFPVLDPVPIAPAGSPPVPVTVRDSGVILHSSVID